MRTLPLEDNSGKVAGEAEWGFKNSITAVCNKNFKNEKILLFSVGEIVGGLLAWTRFWNRNISDITLKTKRFLNWRRTPLNTQYHPNHQFSRLYC